MVSVIIATKDSERLLLPTLAALVPGALSGLVREVIIADAGSHDATAAIADMAGCRVHVADQPEGVRLKAAAELARGGWLMFLRPGTVPEADWPGAVERFLMEAEASGDTNCVGVFARRSSSAPDWRDVITLVRAMLRSRPAGRGLIIRKQTYARLGGHRMTEDPEADLMRRIGRRRTVILKAAVSELGLRG